MRSSSRRGACRTLVAVTARAGFATPVAVGTEVRPGGRLTIVRRAVLVVEPLEPLAPDTTYVLTWQVPSEVCEPRPVATFTTGALPASSGAEPPAISGATAAHVDAVAPVGACDAGPERHRYVVDVEDGPGFVALLDDDGALVDLWMGGPLVHEVEGDGPAPLSCFTAARVDVAGNLGPERARVCRGRR